MSKILIIEDELVIASLEKDYLEGNGYDVHIERTGAGGAIAAKTGEYDLILLDIMLPDVEGFDVCREIRKTLDIPIIMVSAKTEEIDKVRGLGIGADDYITKPFSPNELVARVKAHLSRYERLAGSDYIKNLIRTKNIVLNPDSHIVTVRGETVSFTQKEFELLQFFMQNPNTVFSKQDLFKKVWDAGQVGDISTVTVHIKKIRNKIEVDPDHPQHIETVWGVGYRFRV